MTPCEEIHYAKYISPVGEILFIKCQQIIPARPVSDINICLGKKREPDRKMYARSSASSLHRVPRKVGETVKVAKSARRPRWLHGQLGLPPDGVVAAPAVEALSLLAFLSGGEGTCWLSDLGVGFHSHCAARVCKRVEG